MSIDGDDAVRVFRVVAYAMVVIGGLWHVGGLVSLT